MMCSFKIGTLYLEIYDVFFQKYNPQLEKAMCSFLKVYLS